MNYLSESIGNLQGNLEMCFQPPNIINSVNRESNSTPLHPNLINGDSDADSGIVAIGPGRIGSSSSNDTAPDVTLACKYVTKSLASSSSSSSSSSNRNSIDLPSSNLPIASLSFNSDKRKPIFQRVRFDDQPKPSVTDFTLRKSFRELFNAPTLLAPSDDQPLKQVITSDSTIRGSTNDQQTVSSTNLNMNSSSNYKNHYSSSALPKETHPLAHRRLTVPSPLNLISSTLSSNTINKSTTERSWSTLPRNNKINSNGKWITTINRNSLNNDTNRENNLKLTSIVNGSGRIVESTECNRTLQKSMVDNNKPDLIESHLITTKLSSSFKVPLTASSSSNLPQTSSSIKVTETSCMSESRSFITLSNSGGHPKEKSLQTADSATEPKITKFCTIDPLESTDSMVCAFASVANVIADDCSSIVSAKGSVDKAVAAAVAAVHYVTNNQVNSSSVKQPSNRSTSVTINRHSTLDIQDIHPCNHDNHQRPHHNFSHQFDDNDCLQRYDTNNLRDERDLDEDVTDDDDKLDHQYEAIFPCGKTSASNQATSKLTASSLEMAAQVIQQQKCNSQSLSSCSSSVRATPTSFSSIPLEMMLIKSKAKVTIGNNSVERESNQSSANSNESELSKNQRSISSKMINSDFCSNIAQEEDGDHNLHHTNHHQPQSHVNNYHNGENANPISTGIRYKSILKRSSTSSPNWPQQSIHFIGEETGTKNRDDEDNNDEDNDGKAIENTDCNEEKSGEENPVGGKDEEEKLDKTEDEVVQKDATVPMALQINGPCSVSSLSSSASSPKVSTSFTASSSSCQPMHQLYQSKISFKNMTTNYLPTNGYLTQSNRLSLINDHSEATYLQPDQVYPNPLPSTSITQSVQTIEPSSSLRLDDASQRYLNDQQQKASEVEYAIITKSPQKKNESTKQLNRHQYHYHLPNNHAASQQLTSQLTVDNKLQSSSTTTATVNPIVKVTRFALDEPDGVNYNHNSNLLKSSSASTITPIRASNNKWLTKRFGGLKKALSRAFSTDRLPNDDGINSNHNLNPRSKGSTSRSTPTTRIKDLESTATGILHDKNSPSTANLNCRPQLINGSCQQNHSSDLTNDLKSFVKSVKNRMSFRRKDQMKGRKAIGEKLDCSKSKLLTINQQTMQSDPNQSNTKLINVPTKDNLDDNQEINQLWGELVELRSDGSQVIELNRSHNKPFGFFLARGTVNNVKGVFVSRMRDEQTQTILTGLIEIGDEIIAIDGLDLKSYNNMSQVNQLMSNKKRVVLTVRPYINQHNLSPLFE